MGSVVSGIFGGGGGGSNLIISGGDAGAGGNGTIILRVATASVGTPSGNSASATDGSDTYITWVATGSYAA